MLLYKFTMNLINWLLEGDVSIQYQTYRDLLYIDKPELQKLISLEGYGKRILDLQNDNLHWGLRYYQPKWISSHYTLLELRRLNILPNDNIDKLLDYILSNHVTESKGVSCSKKIEQPDICVDGMALNFFCYFKVEEERLKSIIDYVISQQMNDGGFNCRLERSGAKHSSLHSTVSLIEGLNSYIEGGYKYRLDELIKIRKECIEFILIHRLYKSDRTGNVINKSFLMLSYPPRWKYDILRALVAIMDSGTKYDERMQDAIDVLYKKRRKDGTWPVQAKHPGEVHFDMEKTGESSRWNTLRVLRVLKYFSR